MADYEHPPDTSRKAYCVVELLTFSPHAAGFRFRRGDEVQDILPADVLAACLERGEVSYQQPDSGR